MNLDVVKDLRKIEDKANEEFVSYIGNELENKLSNKKTAIFPLYFLMVGEMVSDFYATLLHGIENYKGKEIVSLIEKEHVEIMFMEALRNFTDILYSKIQRNSDILIRNDEGAKDKAKEVLRNLKKLDPEHADELDELISNVNQVMKD